MTHTAVRICPHCGKAFHGISQTKRQAAADAYQAKMLHIKQKHPTKA